MVQTDGKRSFNGSSPAVSIIMPVYNVEEYLGDAIDSVLNQSFREYELIIVDDGSTDNCPAIIGAYAERDTRIRSIKVSNGGQGRARNIGLSKASGKYVYFLDSDDMLADGALEKMVSTIESRRLDVLFFESSILVQDGGNHNADAYVRKCSYPLVCDGAELFSQMERNGDCFAPPFLSIVRRDYLSDRGIAFPEGYIHEDEAYTMAAVIMAPKAGVLAERLYIRRYRPSSTMTSLKAESSFLGYLAAWGSVCTLLRDSGNGRYGAQAVLAKKRLSGRAWWALFQMKQSLDEARSLAVRAQLEPEFVELIIEGSPAPWLCLRAGRLKSAVAGLFRGGRL